MMTFSLKLNHRFLLGLLMFCSVALCHGDPTLCAKVFEQGGSSALLRSPECYRWKFPDHHEDSITSFCQTATLKGRQRHQEDRVLCTHDLLIPLPGKKGIEDVRVGVAGVFHGHNGTEASNMISRMFLDYFSVNVQYLAHKKQTTSTAIVDDSFRLDVLKEGLVGSIKDIRTVVATEAKKRKLNSDSTATVALFVDKQIIVANVGDSKAFLCSKKALSPVEVAKEAFFKRRILKRPTRTVVKELTRDHHLDHEIILTPEVTDWKHLTAEDEYLVTASDAVFEKMSAEDACELLRGNQEASMADRLVNTAFEKGSLDNLAAVVVPLRSDNCTSSQLLEEDDAYRKISKSEDL